MITNLFAGLPVTDLDASIDWYTRFFGTEMTRRVGDECLWDVVDGGTVFIEPGGTAGAGRVTMLVTGLDDHLRRLDAAGIAYELETYGNGVRHASVPDPDGNALALAEVPEEG